MIVPQYYPIYVDLEDQHVLVIGGGSIACRKVQTLLEYGARVTIVSPDLNPELIEIVRSGQCQWLQKEYSQGDIGDAILIYSCTDQEEVNAQVSEDAKADLRLINVVDDPVKCSFIVPSIFKRGDLSIAVSTGGSSPMVARKIRADLEAQYGEETERYLALLKSWRSEIKSSPLSVEEKMRFWEKVTDGEVLDLIKNNQDEKAKGMIQKCFQSLLV